jgi:hypothetical protein
MRPHLALVAFGFCVVSACGSFNDARSSTTDAGAGSDSGSDSAVGFVTAVSDSFERGEPFDPTIWTSPQVEELTTLTISTAESVSPTRSLHVTLDPSSGEGRRAQLRKTLTPEARRIRVSFQLKVTKRPPTGEVYLAELLTTDGHVIAVLSNNDVILFSENNVSQLGLHIPVPLADGWQEVLLEYEQSSTPSARMTVGANPTVSGTVQEGAGTVTAIEVGSSYAHAGDAAEFFMDDMKIERAD